ncbi:unnamed protein product [Ilex paraguariensis]|uniref:Uncharacterized protein n=1 Tax=Ilex paraguariensis TaxID=185542 RepID=A0ABC8TEE4_9AQUA
MYKDSRSEYKQWILLVPKMKAAVHPLQVNKGFSHGDHGFGGMKNKVSPKKKVSPKNRAFSFQLWRNLRSEKRPRKVKSGVTFFVLARIQESVN